MAIAFLLLLLAAPAAAPCLQAVQAIPAGAVPVRADFVPAACPERSERPLRYEPRSGAARTVRDIAEGEIIAAPVALLPDIRPGDSLFLVTRVGTATVEREVTAVQPGRHGQAIFVRTADGRLLSARLPEEGQ